MRKIAGLAGNLARYAPAIGAAAGGVHGALQRDQSGQRGGIGGAVRGAAVGGALGFGAQKGAKFLANRGIPKQTSNVPMSVRRVTPSAVLDAKGNKLAFATGFSKVALDVKGGWRALTDTKRSPIAQGVGKMIGRGKAVRQEIGSGLKRAVKGTGEAAGEGFRKGYNPKNLPAVKPTQSAKKAPFWKRHPIMTAAGGLGAYHMLSGGQQQQQQQQSPQIYQPSY